MLRQNQSHNMPFSIQRLEHFLEMYMLLQPLIRYSRVSDGLNSAARLSLRPRLPKIFPSDSPTERPYRSPKTSLDDRVVPPGPICPRAAANPACHKWPTGRLGANARKFWVAEACSNQEPISDTKAEAGCEGAPTLCFGGLKKFAKKLVRTLCLIHL